MVDASCPTTPEMNSTADALTDPMRRTNSNKEFSSPIPRHDHHQKVAPAAIADCNLLALEQVEKLWMKHCPSAATYRETENKFAAQQEAEKLEGQGANGSSLRLPHSAEERNNSFAGNVGVVIPMDAPSIASSSTTQDNLLSVEQIEALLKRATTGGEADATNELKSPEYASRGPLTERRPWVVDDPVETTDASSSSAGYDLISPEQVEELWKKCRSSGSSRSSRSSRSGSSSRKRSANSSEKAERAARRKNAPSRVKPSHRDADEAGLLTLQMLEELWKEHCPTIREDDDDNAHADEAELKPPPFVDEDDDTSHYDSMASEGEEEEESEAAGGERMMHPSMLEAGALKLVSGVAVAADHKENAGPGAEVEDAPPQINSTPNDLSSSPPGGGGRNAEEENVVNKARGSSSLKEARRMMAALLLFATSPNDEQRGADQERAASTTTSPSRTATTRSSDEAPATKTKRTLSLKEARRIMSSLKLSFASGTDHDNYYYESSLGEEDVSVDDDNILVDVVPSCCTATATTVSSSELSSTLHSVSSAASSPPLRIDSRRDHHRPNYDDDFLPRNLRLDYSLDQNQPIRWVEPMKTTENVFDAYVQLNIRVMPSWMAIRTTSTMPGSKTTSPVVSGKTKSSNTTTTSSKSQFWRGSKLHNA